MSTWYILEHIVAFQRVQIWRDKHVEINTIDIVRGGWYTTFGTVLLPVNIEINDPPQPGGGGGGGYGGYGGSCC